MGELHSRVIDIFVVCDERARTHTACAVTFGHGIQQNDILLQTFQLHHGEMFHSVVAELAIHLIGEQEKIMFFGNRAQLADLLFSVEIACGVVGVAHHNGFGLRGDEFLKLLDGRQSKTVVNGGNDGLYHHTASYGEAVVVGIERFGDDNLVARIHTAVESEQQTLAATRGDENFIGRKFDAHAVVIFNQLLAVTQVTSGVGISDNRHISVLDSLTSTLGCLDIRLADIQVINVNSARLGCIGERHQFTNR